MFSANTSWYLYNFRYSTLQTVVRLGYRVICLSPKDKYSEKLTLDLGCEWIDLKMDNKGSNPLKDLLTIFEIYKVVRKYKPSIIYNFTVKNNIYGTIVGNSLGIRTVNNVSGLGTAFIYNNFTANIVKFLYRKTQNLAYKVFCQNPDDFNLLVDNKLVPKHKLTLLPGSGVDIEKFHPSFLKNRREGKPFKFLFVGRLLGDKGVRELVKAAQLLSESGFEFELSLCGFTDSENISAISEQELSEWGRLPYIHWLGSSDNIRDIYSTNDCIVLPSYREGMPRTLLEAGALGIPSIASNVPGCNFIVTEGYNGFLCEAKSPVSLYEAMKKMLMLDEGSYHQLSKCSRERVVKEYNEQIVIDHALSCLID